VSRYQKGKTNLDFTGATDSEWQLGHMQVCTSLQTDNHASTPPLKSFLQAGCPSCRPTNSVKALKAINHLQLTGKYPAGCSMVCLAVGCQGRQQCITWQQQCSNLLIDVANEVQKYCYSGAY